MNQWNGCGRPTKEIECRWTAEGLAVARFTLAVNRRSKDRGADFISCVAFGTTAETISLHVHKGTMIGITGHVQTGSYEGKNGKVYTTDVVVDYFDFMESKKDKPDELSRGKEGEVIVERTDGFMNIADDEDIPF